MKHAISAGFIGIAITIALDSLARVAISIYLQFDILMIAYSSYPGIVWPFILTLVAGVTSFLGGAFSLTYERAKKKTSLTIFLVLLIILRYGQIHLLIDTEQLLYPILAMILSLLGLFLAWKLAVGRKKEKATHHFPSDEDAEESPES